MINNKINGFIHYVVPGKIISSHKGKIYLSRNGGLFWEETINLKSGLRQYLALYTKLSRRLSRHYIYHVLPVNNKLAVFGLKSFYLLDPNNDKMLFKTPIVGSRPLSICSNSDGVYYGEYINNKERHPVKLWFYSTKKNVFQRAWKFENIRHIHGVHYDPFEKSIWVTTGDANHESFIWRARYNFQTIEKVAGGNQQHRAIKLIFTKESVFFGSDTPEETNHLYKMSRYDNTVNKLAQVGGSVFHGCKVGNWLFFSTAVEKSSVNTSPYSEVWASPDGEKWKCILRFKKDCWDKKYFQYGQVFFPGGSGDGENLWLTPFATKFDQRSFKIDLNNIEKLYKDGGITFK